MKNLNALHEFFREHYSDSALRRLARACSKNGDLVAELCGKSATFDEIIDSAVAAFERHGAIDDHFWECVRKERPRLTAKIAALKALLVSPPTPDSPLQVVLTRSHVPDSRQLVELEFVLRNDGSVTQVIKELHITAQELELDYQTSVEFSMASYCDVWSIKVYNKGWGPISMTGDVVIRCGQESTRLPVDLANLPGGRWAFLWGHQDPHIPVPKQDGVAEIRVGIENHTTRQYSTVRRQLRLELCEALRRRPDTTYVCILDAEKPEQVRTYRILRSIAPGELDVFQCAVSASKAARFNVNVDILTAEDVRLSAQYRDLRIWRDSFDDWMHGYVEDGDVFVLGPDDLWRLDDPKGARRRF